MKLRNFIKATIRGYLNENIHNENNIWYHGSPHLFDKFDIGKIGTGEGGILAGWGLYFDKSKDTAISYAKSLKNMKFQPSKKNINGVYTIKYRNKDLKDTKIGYVNSHLITNFAKEVTDKKHSLKQVINDYLIKLDNEINKSDINNYRSKSRLNDIDKEIIFCNKLLDIVDKLEVVTPNVEYIDEIIPDVYLYEVSINTGTFLIQDELLNDVAKNKILKMCSLEGISVDYLDVNNNDGGLIYGYLADLISPKKASLLLSKYGIGGLIYKKTNGAGCVVYDDRLINIIKKENVMSKEMREQIDRVKNWK